MLASAFLIFAANGLQAGVYVVLIADVADALDLSDGALGLRSACSRRRACSGCWRRGVSPTEPEGGPCW